MKIQSNTIIIVIIAFLFGIIVTSAFNKGDKEITEVEVTEAEVQTEEELVEEVTEEDGAETAPVVKTAPVIKAPVANTSCVPNINGYKDSKLKAIVINWDPCASEDFQYYKILKSNKNPNPSYPADPVVVSSSNRSLNNHIDKTVSRATTYYYRACVIERLKGTQCGNTISITY